MNPQKISEEIVFKTNSDSSSLVIVLPDGTLLYASKGLYGPEYVLRPRPGTELDSPEILADAVRQASRAFYVEPEELDERLSEQERERLLQPLPEEVRQHLQEYELIQYRYYEVTVSVKKVSERYVLVTAEPKPDGLKLKAKAVRFFTTFSGSRRHPKGHMAGELVSQWRLKYADNPAVQRMYAVKLDWRDSVIYYKVVLEAPRELASATTAPAPQAQQQQQAVVVNGFLVASSLPSKALLDTHLPEIFRDMQIGSKRIKLVMGYFYNKLGTLSRKFYTQILPRYAVYAGFGYIVPKQRAPEFLAAVDQLKREYEEYERQLKDFLLYGAVPEDISDRAKLYKDYLALVEEYLSKQGVQQRVREKIEALDIAGRVRVNLIPFSLDLSVLEEYVDENIRRRVAEEIESVRREVGEAVRRELEERARVLLEKLQRYAQRRLSEQLLEAMRREVEKIRSQAAEFNVHVKALDLLAEAVEQPEKIAEIRASGRVKALIQSLS